MTDTYKQIIITGASSMIGQPLLLLLQKEYSDKLALTPVSRKLDNDYSAWDMQNQNLRESELNAQLENTANKALIHCAPIWFLNGHITALATSGVRRVIVFSSTSIEGKSTSTSPHEQNIVKFLKDAEKSIAKDCAELGVALTIFRPTLIYGNGQGQNIAFIAKIIEKIGIFPVVTNASGLRKPVYIEDLANAAFLALHEPKTFSKTYNLSGAEILSYEQMVAKIFTALNKKKRMPKLPLPIYRLSLITLSKLAKLFGKSLPIDPSMANRMREDLNFDSASAEQDFAYKPSVFLPNGKRDLIEESE